MFDKKRFSEILKEIYNRYDNQRAFANAAGVNRAYLSRYMNMKISNPPSPKILKNIADGSKGITSYEELMQICGYFNYEETEDIKNSITKPVKDSFYTIPIFISKNGKLTKTIEDMMLPFSWDHIHSYFAFRVDDESMSPALGINDIAIVEKTDKFKDEQVCLISLNNQIMIRIIKDYKNYIELQALNYHFNSIKLDIKELENQNFVILGKVIKAENESLFK